MNFPVIFFIVSVVALLLMRGRSINERVEVYSRGAGQPDLLLMVWIFLLAGAFASTAKAMGSISAVVELTLAVMPASMLLPGLFLASCLVSFSIGTSVGTIAALVPVAAGMAGPAELSLPLTVGCVVGGSFFGDNLSFISDTTIVATRTQGIRLKDKFLANFRLVLPAALIALALYALIGAGQGDYTHASTFGLSQILSCLPYIAVIVLALCGVNVMVTLLAGNLLAGVVGLLTQRLGSGDWSEAITAGLAGMQETILIALMAGGLLAVVREAGILERIIRLLTRKVSGQRGAEFAIAGLVSMTNCFTANNTVAILSVGELSRDIAKRFGVDPRKSASLLDTFSCVTQGLLPYGAQVLIAAGLSGLEPLELTPYLYYCMILGLVSLGGILFRYPRSLSRSMLNE